MMIFFFCCLLCTTFRYLSLDSEILFIFVRVIITHAIDVETRTIFIDGFLVLCWVFGLNIFHKFHKKTEWATWPIPWPIFSPFVSFYCPYSYLELGFFSYTPSGVIFCPLLRKSRLVIFRRELNEMKSLSSLFINVMSLVLCWCICYIW